MGDVAYADVLAVQCSGREGVTDGCCRVREWLFFDLWTSLLMDFCITYKKFLCDFSRSEVSVCLRAQQALVASDSIYEAF